MNSSHELKIPEYKKLENFISKKTSNINSNIKLENTKWEMLSDDSKHYINYMRSSSKEMIKRRKAQDQLLIEMLFIFQEFPELNNASHWDIVFKKAKSFFFTKSKEEFAENSSKMNLETKAYFNCKFVEEEEEN